MTNNNLLTNLQDYAATAIDQHRIPAVSLAVWHEGELRQAAAGVLNLQTGVEATTDAIFQIGSITKVFTACLVMQLVDEGRVELDAPVKRYVRDFQIADPEATQTITVRQLLNHTSGMAGDYFPDDNGHQGNLIARFVDRCNLLPLVHPVGAMYSYSNSAFAIAGRLVEVVRGISWYQAMMDYIYKPLGMHQAIADPADVLRYRAAMGHVFDGANTERWVLPERTYLTLGQAPVGSTPTMSAANLITFARAHLDNGRNQAGDAWLSSAAIKTMQTRQLELPQQSLISRKYAGVGWGLTDYPANDLRVVGHAGATIGQLAMLQVIPEQQTAFAILMNGFRPAAMDAITADLLTALTGLDTTEPEPSATGTDSGQLTALTGRYESMDTRIDVSLKDGKLFAHTVYKVDPLPPETQELKPVEGGCFATYSLNGKRSRNLAFVDQDQNGVPAYLFRGGRLNQRVNHH
jgi:CubicO group peptidase (beta-lactamase class C family)